MSKKLKAKDVSKNHSIRNSIIFLIASILISGLSYLLFYRININPKDTALKVGKTKITIDEYNDVYEKLKDKSETINFIVDTTLLSEKAKSQDIAIEDDDLDRLGNEYTDFKDKVALSRKFKEDLYEKVNNATLNDITIFYEENKIKYFTKDSSIEYYAIQSSKDLQDNIDFSKLNQDNKIIGTIDEFRSLDIDLNNIYSYINKPIFVEKAENLNRYIAIKDIDIKLLDINNKDDLESIKEIYKNIVSTIEIEEFLTYAKSQITIEDFTDINNLNTIE